jgi:hypothetical protein
MDLTNHATLTRVHSSSFVVIQRLPPGPTTIIDILAAISGHRAGKAILR